jgi:hypothetical protein
MTQTKTNNMENFTTKAAAKKFANVSYLGGINTSSKIAKNGKVSHQYTYSLYLLPAKASGYQVCAGATKECIKGCLNTSGRVIMDINNANNILTARYKKTRLFFEQRDLFLNWLVAELKTAQKKAKKDGFGFSVRLNCTSDLNWDMYLINGKSIFDIFPNVQFYDYTKIARRTLNVVPNYDLTFSYNGKNWLISQAILNEGMNVAVIFNIKKGQPLPTTYKGYKVLDGDLTDYRPNDEKGCIVGLRWKKIADKATNDEIRNSIFVVQEKDILKDKMKQIEYAKLEKMGF